MKKVIIILFIVAIIIIANVVIFNLADNNGQIASTNKHVNTNINRINNENESNTANGSNEVIRELVQSVDGTIVECNTAFIIDVYCCFI